ncbi:MAG: hypothetical protein IJ357_04515 [Oscillospiraceae bacterium]|nr:hypothetical protein [Oscillospiraceae bacterium]
MKKFLAFLLLFGVLALAGCAGQTQSVTIEAYGITLSVPEGWATEADSAFDLQLSDGTGYMSLMAYYRDEVDMSPTQVHAWHDEALLADREAVSELEAETTEEIKGKTVTTVVYAAGSEGEENYYSSSMVELSEDLILWMVVSGPVDEFEADRDMIHDVLASLSTK